MNRMDYRAYSSELNALTRKALLLTNSIANAGMRVR